MEEVIEYGKWQLQLLGFRARCEGGGLDAAGGDNKFSNYPGEELSPPSGPRHSKSLIL